MRRRFTPVLLALAALIAMPALAQEPKLTGALKKIKESGVLNVGYAESEMPFSYLDRTRNVVGYSIDVCKTVIEAVKADLRKPDLKVEMRPIKPEDAGSYVVSGVIDMHCGPIQNTWQRKSQVDFGPTYFVRRYRFASHESSHMDELTDVHGRTLATLYGSATTALQAFAAAHNLQPKVIPTRSVGEAFEMFRNGGADAVLVDEISLAEGVERFQQQEPPMVVLANG
jgi:glutamate/aspartate transport system substrate-binding protein